MKKLVAGFLALALAVSAFSAPCYAEEGKTSFNVAGYGTFTLTNAEGQTLSTEMTSADLVGTMPHSDPDWSISDPSHCSFKVPHSASYVFEPKNNDIGRVDLNALNINGMEGEGFSIDGTGIRQISIAGNEVRLTGDETIEFEVIYFTSGDKYSYILEGHGKKEVSFKAKNDKLIPAGILGEYTVSEWNPRTGDVRNRQTLTASGPIFTDFGGDQAGPPPWYYEAASKLIDMEVISGFGDGSIKPGKQLNRAEFLMMLYQYGRRTGVLKEDLPASKGTGQFRDVPEGSWFTDVVNWAAENELIFGVTKDLFRPYSLLTFEQMETIFYRFVQKYQIDLGEPPLVFIEYIGVSDWAYNAVDFFHKRDVWMGYPGRITERNTASRADAMFFLYKAGLKGGLIS